MALNSSPIQIPSWFPCTFNCKRSSSNFSLEFACCWPRLIHKVSVSVFLQLLGDQRLSVNGRFLCCGGISRFRHPLATHATACASPAAHRRRRCSLFSLSHVCFSWIVLTRFPTNCLGRHSHGSNAVLLCYPVNHKHFLRENPSGLLSYFVLGLQPYVQPLVLNEES